MSRFGGKPVLEEGKDSLSDRLRRQSLSCSEDDKDNKPDFRELDLGSPVSPLRTRGGGLTATTTTTTTTTTTSSSSSSSGSVTGRSGLGLVSKKSDSQRSGETSADSSPTIGGRGSHIGHSRSHSIGGHPSVMHSRGISSGGSSVNSPPPPVNVAPTGNLFPSGKVVTTGLMTPVTRPDVLSLGTGVYGHGSIMRAGAGVKSGSGEGVNARHPTNVRASCGGSLISGGSGGGSSNRNDPEEFKRLGNESYKVGNFSEALQQYEKAILMSPGNATYHCNKAAALVGLNRLVDAVGEYQQTIRLDPSYEKAHRRLGSLYISLGQVANAKRHLDMVGVLAEPLEVRKFQLEVRKVESIEEHIARCNFARKASDWKIVLREAEAAIAAGADSSPQLLACKAEALLKLLQLDDADFYLSSISKLHVVDTYSTKFEYRFFGIAPDAYVFYVRAQIELAIGRFENACTSAEKAWKIDCGSADVRLFLNTVRMVAKARTRGNDLFKSERYTEACLAYEEGLKLDPLNAVLYCNRAACRYMLGNWQLSLDDCNQALRIQPNYTKALLRRAASNSKLERWAEAVRDYEILKRELPQSQEVAEALFHAQVALKKSRGEDVSNLKFGGEVELVTDFAQFRAEISSPAYSVVHFLSSSNQQCRHLSPVLDKLCHQYPSINFLKVDIEENPVIADMENVRIVPTIKIYKKSSRVKELVCPSPEVLESSVRHYST